ncbi:pantetheine-phosphate adenylyltransferase [Lentilactobacillus sp. SPB1-3]|uniref:Pantetheine-phosphate adenylyltransferase n=1 Tax=Lentilactobacillus terminaliae TaxID=3003483 RepID=A0ACD5DDS8_9LACO|nr:pantetheine-phosphate adenylyltransferase [Lentilactobacillus sp. SPB1-3]MCZ0977868.1 pantetheine-phosphate adenylyltransferase [Lentilactobacillus sp. SPB1-3]
MKTAVYAGSFDPITLGHVDVIERAAKLFDKVLVVVGINTSKQAMFSSDDRRAMIEEALETIPNVEVLQSDELTVRFAQNHDASFLVRGVRGSGDIESEMAIADLNQQLAEGVQTVFLPTSSQYRSLSSSMIKEIAKFHGDVTKMVPSNVAKALSTKFN